MSESLESIQARSQPIVPPFAAAAPIVVHEEKQPAAADEEQSDLIKTFTLRIELSQNHYRHKTVARLNALHGPWPKSGREDEDSVYSALKQVVPADLAAPGLCDWYTGGQLLEETKHIRVSSEASKHWHFYERSLRRKNRLPSSFGEETLATWNTVDKITRSVAQGNNENGP